MKKSWFVALFIVMTIFILSACSGNTDEAGGKEEKNGNEDNNILNEEGMPIVKEPIEMTMFASKRFASQDWNDIMIWNEYEKMTNIKVKFDTVDRDNLAEKRNILLASGDYPDAFFGNGLSVNDLMNYGGQGEFVALNDLIDKYAPNFSKLLEEYPEVKKAITMPDGNIYSFPVIYDPEFKSMLMGPLMWYKKEWLDELGRDFPETTEEFYQLLKEIKAKYPDAIPIGGGPGIDSYLIPFFKGAWGLGNRGGSHPNVDIDPETNELRFIPTDSNYKEMLQYLNKIYSEDLIDKDFFTANADQIIAKGSSGVYGVLPDYNPEAVYSNLQGYIGGNALIGPHGDQIYAHIGSPIGSPGQFVISKKNKYPEATIRWVDHLYSEEGSKMFFMGFKDETYVETADGKFEYTDEIKNNPNGLTQDQAVGQYLVWPGSGYPGILKQEFFQGSEGMPSSLEAAKRVEPYIPEEIWAPFNYTIEELEEMNALRDDIETYIKEMNAKFITGAASFDDWDNYVKTFDKMGLDRYMKIYQDAYDRYTQQ
ncbi:extracellular solute-binding protein [Bacillus niameyensis]|uniref:extracellular solute-binding protein n=1 Tax=Bacillus niameyensis TaxID=1522308 RepID=UPI000783BE2A|nr:extracellular solute-binding protein [Bacillus niameyensis]